MKFYTNNDSYNGLSIEEGKKIINVKSTVSCYKYLKAILSLCKI